MDALGSPADVGRICETCVSWRRDEHADSVGLWGQCRRMPPTMPPIQDDKLVHVGFWPHTQRSDWCGEWSPRDRRENPTVRAADA